MIGAFDALWAVVLDDLDTERVDLQPRHHAVRPAADPVRCGRGAPGPAGRPVPGRHRRPARSGRCSCSLYGLVPSGGAMFAVAMVHAVNDGLTVSSTGVAVGIVVPRRAPGRRRRACSGRAPDADGRARRRSMTGVIYEHAGRTAAYAVAAAADGHARRRGCRPRRPGLAPARPRPGAPTVGPGRGPTLTAMRVGILTREYPPDVYGGAGVHVDFLARELRRLVDVDVHCLGRPPGGRHRPRRGRPQAGRRQPRPAHLRRRPGDGRRRRGLRPRPLPHVVRQPGRPPGVSCSTTCPTSSRRTRSNRSDPGSTSSSAVGTGSRRGPSARPTRPPTR